MTTYTVEIVNSITGSVRERFTGFDTYQEASAKRIDLQHENHGDGWWLNFHIIEEST